MTAAGSPLPFAGRKEGVTRLTEQVPNQEQSYVVEQLFRMLSDMRDLLTGIREDLRLTRPRGIAYPLLITVTSNAVLAERVLPALFSLQLTNDGLLDVQYRMPNASSADWVDLPVTETHPHVSPVGAMTSIALRLATAPGAVAPNTATVRLVGFY